jgi:hypothetical protein
MIPFTTITLDRPRRLRFGMSAMCEFEALTGIRLTSLDDELSVATVAKILWVMLRQDEPTLTFEQVCTLVDEHTDNLTDVMTAVTTAVQAAFGTGDDHPNAAAPAAARASRKQGS